MSGLSPVQMVQSAELVMGKYHMDSLAMADFVVKSAIFRALGRKLGAPASREPVQIVGRMAELLMKSAIATLAWRCFDHDQLRRPNHLDRGQPRHPARPQLRVGWPNLPGPAVQLQQPIAPSAKARIGYPTQKPIELLEDIIASSSNEGDIVLDPFRGCATASVAAENRGRRWIGIDISPKAVELVNMRLPQSMGDLFHNRLVTARTDIPRRTDIDAPVPYRQNKHLLFGQQEGRCNGCRVAFEFRNITIDHIIPEHRGGTDHIENLQLLCGHCNSVKGDRPHEYLVARLKELGIAA